MILYRCNQAIVLIILWGLALAACNSSSPATPDAPGTPGAGVAATETAPHMVDVIAQPEVASRLVSASAEPEIAPYLVDVIPPCLPAEGSSIDPCEPGSLHGGSSGASIYVPDVPFSLQFYLEGWVRLAVPHLMLRGTYLPDTIRCDGKHVWRDAVHYVDIYDGTFNGRPILHCFADVRVNEYFVGTGPSILTLEVAHELFFPSGENPASIEKYEQLWERILIEGGRVALASGMANDSLLNGIPGDIFDAPAIPGKEEILFVGPSPNVSLEALKVIWTWKLERKTDDTVVAVHPSRWYYYGTDQQDNPVLEMTLPAFRTAATAAQTAKVAATGGRTRVGTRFPNLITDANNLRQFLVEVGSYSHPEGPPVQPIAKHICDSAPIITDPGSKRGLVQDCDTLLAAKDTLRGTGSLNWSTSAAITSWEGATVDATSNQVTELDLESENLTGSIPSGLSALRDLTLLDLSDNSLTGSIPEALADLENLEDLRLSGNSLTGCIPQGLKDIETNDLSSLNLPDCSPAPETPSAGTSVENSVSLSWGALTGASQYRLEYRLGSPRSWTQDDVKTWTVDTSTTTTSRTIAGLTCDAGYRFRLRAYGNGTTYAEAWGPPSPVLATPAGACVLPTFGAASYAFSIAHDSEVGTAVGSVSASGSKGVDDTVTYAITEGNEDGTFAIGESTGEITIAAALTGLAGTTLTLTVEAEDESGGAATVTITVTKT